MSKAKVDSGVEIYRHSEGEQIEAYPGILVEYFDIHYPACCYLTGEMVSQANGSGGAIVSLSIRDLDSKDGEGEFIEYEGEQPELLAEQWTKRPFPNEAAAWQAIKAFAEGEVYEIINALKPTSEQQKMIDAANG